MRPTIPNQIFVTAFTIVIVAILALILIPIKVPDERIEIKKVEVVRYIYDTTNSTSVNSTSVSIKATTEPMQCQRHTVTESYSDFSSGNYLNLLMTMTHPNEKFYLKNPKKFWDEDIKKCILTGYGVESIEDIISHP